MQVYSSEEEQIRAIKNWWRDNGVAVALGIIVGFGGLLGWQGWQHYQNTQAEQASAIFTEIMVALESKQGEGVDTAADKLIKDFPASPYAALASLAAAKAAMLNEDTATAKKRLQWVVDNSKQAELEPLARARLTRLLLQEKDVKGAERLLMSKPFPKSFAARVAELRADVAAAKGDYAAARIAYDEALNAEPAVRNRQMIQMKRDEVAAKPSAAPQLPDIEVQPEAKPEPSNA